MGRPMHARTRRRRDDRQRGAAAVEFALVMLPLLWLVFGVISFGMMLSFRQGLSQAASEGARAAAVQLDASKRVASAESAVAGAVRSSGKECGPSATDVQCAVSSTDCDDADPNTNCVTVTVSYGYRKNPTIPSVPLVGKVLPETLSFSATARVS